MKKLLAIVGPTATGKTDVALKLAKQLNGELISCDSRQVYKHLDIGTGKLPGQEVAEILKGDGYWILDGTKIWMYDVADPKVRYTVADYVKQAKQIVSQITANGQLPILVGGTGLYSKALLEGLDQLTIPFDVRLRESLELLSLQQLQQKLQDLSLKSWSNLNQSDNKNSRRIIRAIEKQLLQSKATSKEIEGLSKEFQILKIGLTGSTDYLRERIRRRVVSRIDQGMITEVTQLQESALTEERLYELGLEYAIITDYLKVGERDKNLLIDRLSTKIYQYAKRQITWFKKDPGIDWFDVSQKDVFPDIEKKVQQWYYTGYDTR